MQNFEILEINKKKLVDQVNRLGIWVIELKNHKSKTDPIIIGLVWFHLKMNRQPEPNPSVWFGSSGSLDQSDLLTLLEADIPAAA